MSWVEKNWKPLTVVGGLLGLSWFAGKRFERAEKPTQELGDYEETFVDVQTENEPKEPYYEVMVDSDSLSGLNYGEFDGARIEFQENLHNEVLSLDYGEGGDEPLMTPSEAKENYMNQISITTHYYEPDVNEDTGEWFGTPNTNIWGGTINFPEGKQREGGEFFARVIGFKESELPFESYGSQLEAENKIMDYIQRNLEVYVRERGEDGIFDTVYDAETFEAPYGRMPAWRRGKRQWNKNHLVWASDSKAVREALKTAFPEQKFGVRIVKGQYIEVVAKSGTRPADIEQFRRDVEGVAMTALGEIYKDSPEELREKSVYVYASPRDFGAETFDAERIKYDFIVHREPKGTKIGKDGKRIPNPKGGWFKSVKDAETFEAYDPMMQNRIDRNECSHSYDDGDSRGGDAWVLKYADLMGVEDGLSYIEAGVKCGICGQERIGSWGINEREGFQITKGEEGRMPRFYGYYGAETFEAPIMPFNRSGRPCPSCRSWSQSFIGGVCSRCANKDRKNAETFGAESYETIKSRLDRIPNVLHRSWRREGYSLAPKYCSRHDWRVHPHQGYEMTKVNEGVAVHWLCSKCGTEGISLAEKPNERSE